VLRELSGSLTCTVSCICYMRDEGRASKICIPLHQAYKCLAAESLIKHIFGTLLRMVSVYCLMLGVMLGIVVRMASIYCVEDRDDPKVM
jgi:hypothetical protein